MGKLFKLSLEANTPSIGKPQHKIINSDFGVPIDNFFVAARKMDGMRVDEIKLSIDVTINAMKDIDELINSLSILKYTLKS